MSETKKKCWLCLGEHAFEDVHIIKDQDDFVHMKQKPKSKKKSRANSVTLVRRRRTVRFWGRMNTIKANYLRSGHKWLTDENGYVDIFAHNPRDPHNGPKCTRCGKGFCWHCTPDPGRCACA